MKHFKNSGTFFRSSFHFFIREFDIFFWVIIRDNDAVIAARLEKWFHGARITGDDEQWWWWWLCNCRFYSGASTKSWRLIEKCDSERKLFLRFLGECQWWKVYVKIEGDDDCEMKLFCLSFFGYDWSREEDAIEQDKRWRLKMKVSWKERLKCDWEREKAFSSFL